MKRLAMLMLVLVPAATNAQKTADSAVTADAVVDTFFEKVKSGQTEAAVSNIFDRTELMAGRTAEKQSMIAQVDNAIKVYGPIRKVELISSEPLGKLYIKRYYLAQHDKMITRWEFELIETPKGWVAGYFGFDDQVRTWK